MKDRLTFYCIAVVALVLILAAAPSHATERRDPILNPDSTQATGSTHKADGVAHPAQRSTNGKKTSHAAKTTHSQGVNSPPEAKSKTAAKSASDAQTGSSSASK